MSADPASLALRVTYLEKQNRTLKMLCTGLALFFAVVWAAIFWPAPIGIEVFVQPGIRRTPQFDHSPASKSRDAQQHYLSGIVFYQKGNYARARDEWKLALRFDPKMSDAQAGLERVDRLYGP